MNFPSSKILFITTSNLSTHPRLTKETEIAIAKGFLVEILCFKFLLSSEMDDNFLSGTIHVLNVNCGYIIDCCYLYQTFTYKSKFFLTYWKYKIGSAKNLLPNFANKIAG